MGQFTAGTLGAESNTLQHPQLAKDFSVLFLFLIGSKGTDIASCSCCVNGSSQTAGSSHSEGFLWQHYYRFVCYELVLCVCMYINTVITHQPNTPLTALFFGMLD